ncbi:MAG: hypothetical protein QRY71_02435 [Candidatus Rhabdochlamydia sp.]
MLIKPGNFTLNSNEELLKTLPIQIYLLTRRKQNCNSWDALAEVIQGNPYWLTHPSKLILQASNN